MVACRKKVNDVPEVFALSVPDLHFDSVPKPIKPRGLSTKRADYLIAIKDHASKEKRHQFVAHINSVRSSVLHPEISDEGVLSDEDEQEEQDAVAVPVNTVIIKKITDEVRAELKKKRAETGLSYPKLVDWLKATHNVHVSSATVGRYLNMK